eukprot:CAMPEP_0182593834 /NCGR_PEP_ID=MMETSP1324-20130603/78908_1 /TAXON_ID=236786 /ORGANISM="Florenciella sp., Strain RCC1587" /LENGTH=63 /DNA_ID=CAMNT_0024811327 /DNA_START=52 /DNA_END=239 /DNA_ORIENTATION=-
MVAARPVTDDLISSPSVLVEPPRVDLEAFLLDFIDDAMAVPSPKAGVGFKAAVATEGGAAPRS